MPVFVMMIMMMMKDVFGPKEHMQGLLKTVCYYFTVTLDQTFDESTQPRRPVNH